MCYPAAIPIALAAVQTVQGVQAARAQASAARQRADVINQEAQQQADVLRTRARAQLASGRVALAKSGVTTEGSPADQLASVAANNELDAQLARWRGAVQAYGRSGFAGSQSTLPAATRLLGNLSNFGNIFS